MSPTKVVLRAKLQEKRQANQADWLAFQEAKKQGLAWPLFIVRFFIFLNSKIFREKDLLINLFLHIFD
jgi:hypothetical protein